MDPGTFGCSWSWRPTGPSPGAVGSQNRGIPTLENDPIFDPPEFRAEGASRFKTWLWVKANGIPFGGVFGAPILGPLFEWLD